MEWHLPLYKCEDIEAQRSTDSKYLSTFAWGASSAGCRLRIETVKEDSEQAQRGAHAGLWKPNCKYSSHFPDHPSLKHNNRISDVSGTQIHTFESRSTGSFS